MTAAVRQPFALALLRAAHPGPTVVVTAITALLCLAALGRPAAVVLLTLGMLCGQLSVGWTNDWLDEGLDRAAHRTDKPAAAGEVPTSALRTAALVALVPGLLLPFGSSAPAGWLHLLFVASAQAYNLGLKRTPASVLPYVVSFGSLPAIATLAASPTTLPAPWTLVVGAALGIAAHFANVVPDAAADRAAGSRGLPQLLGARGSGIASAVVLLIAVVVATVGVFSGGAVGAAALAVDALVLAAACALAGLVLALRRRASRLPFRLVMGAALLLVVALLTAPSALR